MIIYPTTPVRNQCVSLAFHKIAFSPEECQAFINSVDESAWIEGKVGGHGKPGEFLEVPEAPSCREQQLARVYWAGSKCVTETSLYGAAIGPRQL